MKRSFQTRSESNRRLLFFAIGAVLVEYVLNAVNNVVAGPLMAMVWMGGGLVVALIIGAIEKIKSRRRE